MGGVFRFLDPAIENVEHAVPKPRVELRMGHLDDRGPFPIQFLEKLHDLSALFGMQVPGGLIGQQQTRTSNNRPSHSYQLLETAREPAGINVLASDHADAIQHVGHQRLAFRLSDVPIGKRNFEILRHCEIVEQMELLENKADVALVEFASL